MIDALLHLIAKVIPLTSLVLDGHFGHHIAVRTAQQCQVHLISKLRSDSAWSLPYEGPYAGTGPPRKDGSKLDDRSLPEQYLQATTVAHHLQTCVYQAQLRHKEFAPALHVVILVKTNLHTQAKAHVILFSSDLELPYDTLRDSYSLRFQIEFNFRDAKPYWGLEDFMHITPTGVTNAANLSWFMVNVAYRLQADVRQHDPDDSILDLKADCRGDTYVEETITMLVAKPEPAL
jgi:putative transposase